MNLSTKQKQIYRLREDTCETRGERENGMDREFGANRCQLLHLEWISDEVLSDHL